MSNAQWEKVRVMLLEGGALASRLKQSNLHLRLIEQQLSCMNLQRQGRLKMQLAKGACGEHRVNGEGEKTIGAAFCRRRRPVALK